METLAPGIYTTLNSRCMARVANTKQDDFKSVFIPLFLFDSTFIQILIFKSIHIDDVFKFLILFVLLKECPMVIGKTFYLNKNYPLFNAKFFLKMLMYLNQNSNM